MCYINSMLNNSNKGNQMNHGKREDMIEAKKAGRILSDGGIELIIITNMIRAGYGLTIDEALETTEIIGNENYNKLIRSHKIAKGATA